MPSHNQSTVDYVPTDFSMGTSSSTSLQTSFPGSPIHSGDLTREAIQKIGNVALLGAKVNDGGHTFGEHNRDYVDAPNYGDVATGGGGLPTTPFTPNTASPGEGSLLAADQPEGPLPADPGSEFGSGASATKRQPDESSAVMASHTLKDYGLGVRPGS